MKRLSFYGVVFAALACTTACNNNNSKDAAEETNEQRADSGVVKVSDDASTFVVNAANGGMMEVQLGKLAQTNAASADVKKFGQRMIDDHSKANEELKAVAAQKNIAIPDSVSGDKHDMIAKLQDKKGKDFDEAYMDMMVDDHKEDIDEFEKAANNVKDADISGFASRTLPTLQEHLKMAQQIDSTMKHK
jgi:putative membrane protein